MTFSPAYEHNGRPVAREAFYAIACDPRRSVTVEACAGAGKTWMLVSRIVRALLAGAQPQDILAITFTKKAAGEMRQRLAGWLETWSRATDDELHAALVQRGIATPTAADCAALRHLFAQVVTCGRPVQIRTFHSWFAALLRSAPLAVLEALGLPASHELLESDDEAVARVWRRFHAAVAQSPEARRDFQDSVLAFGRSQTLKALEAALARRVEFTLADQNGVVAESVQTAASLFPEFAGFESPQLALAAPGARERWLARAAALGTESAKTPQTAAADTVRAFELTDPAARLAELRKAFFVGGEDRLKQHLQKYPAAIEAEAELQALCAAQRQHAAWLHHQRMARLTRLLIDQFGALKRELGKVDMNDVERTALVLLTDPVLSGWVQERLDARVSHLLIDEFQDTNPLQWQALSAWLGAYAGAAGARPSVFIVGDPKQSIYRFRRAEPGVFIAAQAFVSEVFAGDRLSCDHTHRNAPAVLGVVNAVFTQAAAQDEFPGFRAHTTESGAAGGVFCLPPILREARVAGGVAEAWRDSLTTPREQAEERLITLECRQAARWIAQRIASGTPPADIMVLARRRDRLAAMEEELRELRIPAQQPEKTDLCEAPEVRDIAALLDALVSPGHDLSLAQALKSPLFGATDADLVALATLARAERAQGRGGAWLDLLDGTAGPLPVALQGVGERLRRWQAALAELPPHDVLQAIYDETDLLARFAQAAPAPRRAAAVAALRALLGAALEVQGGRYLTPYAFVRALKAGGIAGPAVAEPGVVRLLTVHGAKGLEAPVVLMLDTDASSARAETMGVLCEWPGEAPSPWRFAFLASETQPPACSVAALQVEQAARLREEMNALYVAMTRAETELVLSSIAPAQGLAASWWSRVTPLAVALPAPEAMASAAAQAAPDFALPVLPAGPQTAARGAAVSRAPDSVASRFGQAMHRLLETADARGEFGPGALRRARREFGLDAAQIDEAAAAARRILSGEGAWVWDARQLDWQGNEVEIRHAGDMLRLDRLVRHRTSGEWWVIDYKSAARPELDDTLIGQLRRYREAVRAAAPGEPVRMAFLTAQGRMVTIE